LAEKFSNEINSLALISDLFLSEKVVQNEALAKGFASEVSGKGWLRGSSVHADAGHGMV
jgi:hypothetical protein